MAEERTKRNGLELFEQALKNVSPVMEVKPRRVGGATYQVPMEVAPYRRFALATRWILQSARARSGRNFSEKLAAELVDAANNTGSAIRKREETHKMAEANRAFSHYRM
jgi:small subunit ribosomal protein S7